MADLQTPTFTSAVDTPSTSNTYPNYNFDVFISHRGPDVKNSFAGHLYRDLHAHGLQPFLDREELQAGKSINPQIEDAIRSAYVQIIIFSPGYADSTWCLNELLLIWEKSEDIIIPVFYKVKPSEPRWAKHGRYAEALAKHEQTGRYDRQNLANWRNALHDVSNRVGDEVKLLEKVVECVLKNRRNRGNRGKTALYVSDHPTGLQLKVEDFENKMLLLQQQQKNDKTRVLGIVGLGGVGKTTLAKELFNRKSCDFKQSCTLYDVREIAGRESLSFLQSKLLKGLTNNTEEIDSTEEGIQILKRHLSSSHALVVIDHVDQLHALLPIKDSLHSDSLILVTSRSKDVLTHSGIQESSIYHLTGLDEQHSRQLFCSHAFFQPYPVQGFECLVDGFCKACDGLPLSLRVLGALVCGKYDISYWERQLDKLRQVKLPSEIRERLKISYDALDAEEKQIFIDIACYFIGEDRHMAVRIWDGSGWDGLMGFLNLQGKCLVEVDGNTIKMHDQLRDLGREIADEERQLRHLWRPTNDIDDLWQQSSVITEVRGIRTVPRFIPYYGIYYGIPESEEEWSWFKSWCDELLGNCLRKLIDRAPYSFRNLQLVATEDGNLKSILRRVESPNLKWLRWTDCPYSCLPSWIPMENLRVLEVGGKKLKTLWQAESQAPLELRELQIAAPLSKFPKSIGRLMHIEKIVVMSGKLESLPEEFCNLLSLKHLHLNEADSMMSLPDAFGFLTNLQELDLTGCESLQALPDSFGCLTNLQELDLTGCESLQALPDSFGCLTNLQELDLTGCESLQALPDSFGCLTNLQELDLSWCKSLQALPDSFGCLTNLQKLDLSWCKNLQALPDSFGCLTNLQELDLS
eukprot:PITA_09561